MPTVVAVVKVGGRPLALLATHPVLPMVAGGMALRDAHLDALDRAVPPGHPAIVVGDLNATPWLRPLRALRAAAGLADSLEGHDVQPSWPADLPWIARIPIDHVLHSSHLATEARTLGRLDVGADHRPVFVQLGFR